MILASGATMPIPDTFQGWDNASFREQNRREQE